MIVTINAVRIRNVFMENVLDILIIHQIELFVNVNRGWSGRYCTIPYDCTCASDSLCIGIANNNRPVCVCSANKFGPRCLLVDTACQINNTINVSK